jgi:non-canonical purine NTP pyrophosphatase (RdgB/HAM1 family)
MNVINFATSNDWKYKHAKDYFKLFNIEVKQSITELPESRSEDVDIIATEKAQLAYREFQTPLFVIDAAFYIKGLNDFPKTYVKFAEKYLGATGILKLLENNPNRDWEVHNVICYIDSHKQKLFHGILRGVVAINLKQDNPQKVREVDRIFIPDGYSKTYSEFTQKEQGDYDIKVWKPQVFDEFIRWIGKQSL